MVERQLGRSGANRFLITGCQRSGTTLVAMALEAHPSIDIVEENDDRFHRQGRITRELDLEAASAQVTTPECQVGYKAPRDSHRIDEVVRTFPLVRVLWVERELRQVVSSMLTLKGASGSWASTFAMREIQKHISRSKDESAERALVVANEIEDPASRSVALATLCWIVKQEQGSQATRRLGSRLLLVRYDDLVTDPSRVLHTVLDFLSLPWSAAVLDHPSTVAYIPRPGQADSRRPIDTTSRNKWRAQLSARDFQVMEQIQRCFESGGGFDRRQKGR